MCRASRRRRCGSCPAPASVNGSASPSRRSAKVEGIGRLFFRSRCGSYSPLIWKQKRSSCASCIAPAFANASDSLAVHLRTGKRIRRLRLELMEKAVQNRRPMNTEVMRFLPSASFRILEPLQDVDLQDGKSTERLSSSAMEGPSDVTKCGCRSFVIFSGSPGLICKKALETNG